MHIRIADDLQALTVLADSLEQRTILGAHTPSDEPLEVASFDKPVLLTDSFRISQLPANLRDAVLSLYQSYPRVVSYRGVSVSWSPVMYPTVWCPSIDTVFLANALSRYVDSVERFAEIGSASGFLTKFILQHGSRVQHGTATDINIEAIRCTHDALADSDKKSLVNLLMPDVDAPTLGLDGTYDLIVTNPPYIPRPNEGHDNPYEGLDVMHKLSKEAKEHLAPGGKIILNVSSLAGDKPLQWFREQGFSVTGLETMRVPLKVNPVTSGIVQESKDWLAYLRQTGLLEEDSSEESGYSYWHTLQIFEISPAA